MTRVYDTDTNSEDDGNDNDGKITGHNKRVMTEGYSQSQSG